jgi:hypothetical protein
MKTFKKLPLILGICLLSCETKQVLSPKQNPIQFVEDLSMTKANNLIATSARRVDVSKIDDMLEIETKEARKVAYLVMLNEDEKYFFWINKLNEFVKNERLSKDQKQLFVDLLNNIEPEVFRNQQNARVFVRSYLDGWSKKVTMKIGILKIGKLLGEIESYEPLMEEEEGDSGGSQVGKPCNCGGTDERFKRCGPQNTCWSDGCTTSWWGCGDLLLQSCDGRCTYFR